MLQNTEWWDNPWQSAMSKTGVEISVAMMSRDTETDFLWERPPTFLLSTAQPLGLVDKSPLICFNGNPSWASSGWLAENWILVLRICPLLRGGWNACVGLGTPSVAFLFAVWMGGILCTPLSRHNRPLTGEFTNQMRLGLYFGSIFAYVIEVRRISTACDLERIIAWIICSPQVEWGEP